MRHMQAFDTSYDQTLDSGSELQWRKMVNIMRLIRKRFIRYNGRVEK